MIGCYIVDVSTLNPSSIKIRFRHATFVVDPTSDGAKTACDAVVLLNGARSNLSKVSDYRVVINGPGEYEISGVKISGTRIDDGLVYNILGDGLGLVLGKTKEVSKIKEEFNFESQIAILNVDSEFGESAVTSLEPKVVILYGDNKDAGAKKLDKGNLAPIKKFTVSKDKLKEEMEVVVLG